MILIIRCDTCDAEIGRSPLNDAHAFMSMLAIIHAGGPHGSIHKLRPLLLLDPTEENAINELLTPDISKHEIKIKCNHVTCRNEITYKDVPLSLCPGLIIAYHSGHEGHPLTVMIDGQSFISK